MDFIKKFHIIKRPNISFIFMIETEALMNFCLDDAIGREENELLKLKSLLATTISRKIIKI